MSMNVNAMVDLEMSMNVNVMVDLEIILCEYTSQHIYFCFYRVLTVDFLMARFGNAK